MCLHVKISFAVVGEALAPHELTPLIPYDVHKGVCQSMAHTQWHSGVANLSKGLMLNHDICEDG